MGLTSLHFQKQRRGRQPHQLASQDLCINICCMQDPAELVAMSMRIPSSLEAFECQTVNYLHFAGPDPGHDFLGSSVGLN